MYQDKESDTSGKWLLEHVLGEDVGFLVTFTGRQARLDTPDARQNELSRIEQRTFPYPVEIDKAAHYLHAQAAAGRDCYFGVHLFRERGNRRAANAAPTVSSLWLDEDEGSFPEVGPEPTAIVNSSQSRRHLYWRLTRAVSVEWGVAMNRRIAVWANGDVGKAGAASVLRVPGTFNYKRHPRVDPVRLDVTGVLPWEPEVLEQAVPPVPPSDEPTGEHRGGGELYDGPRVELLDYLAERGVAVITEAPDGGGRKFAVLCPWVAEHTGGDRTGTFVGQYHDGAMWFKCHHAHCEGRGWTEFRQTQQRELKKSRLVKQGAFYA